MMPLQSTWVSRESPRSMRTGLPAATCAAVQAAPANGQTPMPWRVAMALIERHVPFVRNRLRAGAMLQQTGEAFACVHLVHWGAVKTVGIEADGCSQIAGLHIKGDWIGFDAVGQDQCLSDVRAMNDIEVWSMRYVVLLALTQSLPQLAHMLHVAMAEQLARERHWRLALATMPADARLADFVRGWAVLLAQRELRDDHIAMHLTRGEIANYLGMSTESASRGFSQLARLGLIAFENESRRQFVVPDLGALAEFIDARSRACAAILPWR
jgi:CRP/FNR family transcriptional regulator, anaerobic regulatory protein